MKKIVLITLFSIAYNFAFSQIKMDGVFQDWAAIPSVKTNQNEIIDAKVYDDDDRIYFYIESKKEFKLNETGDIVLLIDTDQDKSTGNTQHGFDLKWEFAERKGTLYQDENQLPLTFKDFGFFYLPTVTSSRYEFTIKKEFTYYDNHYLISSPFEFLIAPAKKVDHISSVYSYEMKYGETYNHKVKIGKKKRNTVRVMTYNVLHDGLLDKERQKSFMEVFKAINPDILTLNECWNTSPDTVSKLFIRYFPGKSWHVSKCDQGNITVSRYPIIKSKNILDKHRISANFIQFGKNKELLVINSHFRCCNNDKERRKEVRAINEFLSELKKETDKEIPVLIMGDLNLVGEAEQLDILLHGLKQKPDWDQTSFTDLITFQTNSNYSYTWYDEESSYSPGRLDFIIYSDSKMKVKNAYILRTEFLDPAVLRKYQLDKNMTKTLSDHLPIVADFKINRK